MAEYEVPGTSPTQGLRQQFLGLNGSYRARFSYKPSTVGTWSYEAGRTVALYYYVYGTYGTMITHYHSTSPYVNRTGLDADRTPGHE